MEHAISFNTEHDCCTDNIIDISVHKDYEYFPPKKKVLRYQTSSPIKDDAKVTEITHALRTRTGKYGLRNSIIWVLGCNVGLRAGDLLSIRVQDIYDHDKATLRDVMTIQEQKRGKVRHIRFSAPIQKLILEYIASLKDNSPYAPLFPSQKKLHKTTDRKLDTTGCLSVKSYWRILKEIQDIVGVQHLGTHTLRKTFGRKVYRTYVNSSIKGYSPLDVVQKILGHSSSGVTMRYIGIDEEIEEAVYEAMNLGNDTEVN